MAIVEKDDSVRITVTTKRLDFLLYLDGNPLSRGDEVFVSLDDGRVLFIFDLFSAFHKVVTDPDTIYLSTICTPNQLFGFFRMPQGADASPSWYVAHVV